MSVVKINAITVPAERADELVARFANRAGEVSKMPGFEAFELLRPTDDRDVFLVYTRWRSQEDFDNWLNGQAFQQGHAGHAKGGPVGTGSELWSFDVVQHEVAPEPVDVSRSVVVFAAVTEPDPVLAQLTGPGGPFEIVREDVLGVETQVYAQRMRTLRELMAQSAARADLDFVVQGDDARRSPDVRAARRAGARGCRGAGAPRRRRGRPRRVVLGEQSRLGRDVLGVRGARRGRRAAERVVEGRGARVRPERLRGEGVDLRRAPAGGDRRPARRRSRRCEHVFVIGDASPDGVGALDRCAVRRSRRRPRRSRRGAARRRRPARDHLHVGHDGPAEGRDAHAPAGDREPVEHHRARCRGRDARHAAARSRRPACSRRRCSSCRCST